MFYTSGLALNGPEPGDNPHLAIQGGKMLIPGSEWNRNPAYERAIIRFKPLKQLPDKYHPVYSNANLARRECRTYAQTAGVHHEGAGGWGIFNRR